MQEAKNVILQMRFPQKLWYLIDMGTDAILWGGTGRTILLNYRILQNYLQCDHSIFKTTNISSFIRQLNLYGFRKVTSHLQDPLCNSSNPYMHEFIHDNFQYGRHELLNKITRKALTVKKSFKPKSYLDNLVYMSPLQKARRALRLALHKAAQDILDNTEKSDSAGCDEIDFPQITLNKLFENYNTDDNPRKWDPYQNDVPEDFCADEENVEFEWLEMTKNSINDTSNEIKQPDPTNTIKAETTEEKFGNISQENLIDFSVDACQQNNSFSNQFLSMPDLDEPNEDHSGVELLAEFNIGSETDQGIIRKSSEIRQTPVCNSLNCVLPSVSNEHIDDISMLEKSNEDIIPYNSEWDQMFNDMMMSNRNSNQEGVSNLRELYSQISQTIDLLNS